MYVFALRGYLYLHASSQRVVLIDADMMVLRNMDELMDMELPPGHIAATHGCVCNLDKSPWAPSHWYVPDLSIVTLLILYVQDKGELPL